jgi:hypothetical protein
MHSRSRDQRREAGDEVERVEDDGACAVPPSAAQAVDDAAVSVQGEAFAGDGRAGEIAGEPLAPLEVVCR